MKKGFTLVELMAVLVILTLILLMATPAIKKTVDNSKRKVAENDALMIAKIAQDKYASNMLDYLEVSNMDLTSDDLKYSGSKPKKGKLLFNSVGEAYGKIYINGYCVTVKTGLQATSEKVSIDDCDVTSIA